MRYRLALLAVLAAGAFAVAPAAYADPVQHPPSGGIGDTPLNSAQAQANAGDNFFAAVDQSQAINALVRNPTCGAYSVHGNG
jgi:hypothetical protein